MPRTHEPSTWLLSSGQPRVGGGFSTCSRSPYRRTWRTIKRIRLLSLFLAACRSRAARPFLCRPRRWRRAPPPRVTTREASPPRSTRTSPRCVPSDFSPNPLAGPDWLQTTPPPIRSSTPKSRRVRLPDRTKPSPPRSNEWSWSSSMGSRWESCTDPATSCRSEHLDSTHRAAASETNVIETLFRGAPILRVRRRRNP